jgi:sporulation-control protein spo0M
MHAESIPLHLHKFDSEDAEYFSSFCFVEQLFYKHTTRSFAHIISSFKMYKLQH